MSSNTSHESVEMQEEDARSQHSYLKHSKSSSASDKKSQKTGKTDASSAKTVNLVEESVFTLLSSFRFESTPILYSVVYNICGIYIFATALTVCLPASNANSWVDITLQAATIIRTLGFRYIPGIAWFYIVPAMGFVELMMIATIVVATVLYSRGLMEWITKMKYILYALGLFLTITLFPMLYGLSFFFDCNWKTGYYQRDTSMMCWSFTFEASGVLGILACVVILLQIGLCCFFVAISCEMNPKRIVSFFAVDEIYVLVLEVLFNSVMIVLQEILKSIATVVWLPYIVYLSFLVVVVFITFRFLPFYSRWMNSIYTGTLFARLFLTFLSLIVFTVQANYQPNPSDIAFSICLVIMVLLFVIGFIIGFALMTSYQYIIIAIVQHELNVFEQENSKPAELPQEEITVTKIPSSKMQTKWTQFLQYLTTLSLIELAMKIHFMNTEEGKHYVETIIRYCEAKKLLSPRLQLQKAIYTLYFTNNPRLAFQFLRHALYDLKPNFLLKITIWIRNVDVSASSDTTQNERVDKLILSVKKLEDQLRQELKHLFELYIQKASEAKLLKSNESIQHLFSTIRSTFNNMTRNYKHSKVLYCYAHFVDEFEKNSLKSMALLEKAKELQDQEEERLKRFVAGGGSLNKNTAKARLKSNRVIPMPLSSSTSKYVMKDSSNEYSMEQSNIHMADTLVQEIDALEKQNDSDEEEESKEESYRNLIRAERSKVSHYLFIIATILVPILVIIFVAIFSVALSTTMYNFSDIGVVARVPAITLSYLRQVRMHMNSHISSISSILDAEKSYRDLMRDLRVDEYWSKISCSISYPIINEQIYFKHESGSLLDLSRMLLQNIHLLNSELSNNSNIDTSPRFLFVWSNLYQIRTKSAEFVKFYFDLAESQTLDFVISFFTVAGVIYLVRIMVFLIITFGVGLHVFREKNRILNLFRDLLPEAFATAYRSVDKSSHTVIHPGKTHRTSALSAIPIRVLIVLIYLCYLILELGFIAASFGVYGSQVSEFQKNIELVYNIASFRNALNQINFVSNEFYFDTSTSTLLKNTLIVDSNNGSLPISYIAYGLSSTELLKRWSNVMVGTDTSSSLNSMTDSIFIKTVLEGRPCIENINGTIISTTAPFSDLEMFWNYTCGYTLNDLVLKYILESTQMLETLSKNTTTAAAYISMDVLWYQYNLCTALAKVLSSIVTELLITHNKSQSYLVFSSVVGSILIVIILSLAVPYCLLWNRVLYQGFHVRQLLLFFDVETLESVSSIREYIVRYTIKGGNVKLKKKLSQIKATSVIQAALDAVVILNSKMKIQSVNRACTNMLEYTSAELLGQVGQVIFIEDISSLIQELYTDRKPFTKELHMKKKDGLTIPMRTSAALANWNDQEMVCIFARDLTLEKKQNELLNIEKQNSEKLLLNILPDRIAQRLKNGETQIAERFDDATILFSDMCNFTVMSGKYTPMELISLLNDVVTEFDDLSIKHGLEKIKTIGDAYMLVGGLTPTSSVDHPKRVCCMAIDMLQFISNYNLKRQFPAEKIIRIRIGINTGPISAGIVGKLKFVYDLFGDAINVASRMESSGVPMRIHVSRETYERVFDLFRFEEKTTDVKGKGTMKTYLMKHIDGEN